MWTQIGGGDAHNNCRDRSLVLQYSGLRFRDTTTYNQVYAPCFPPRALPNDLLHTVRYPCAANNIVYYYVGILYYCKPTFRKHRFIRIEFITILLLPLGQRIETFNIIVTPLYTT